MLSSDIIKYHSWLTTVKSQLDLYAYQEGMKLREELDAVYPIIKRDYPNSYTLSSKDNWNVDGYLLAGQKIQINLIRMTVDITQDLLTFAAWLKQEEFKEKKA